MKPLNLPLLLHVTPKALCRVSFVCSRSSCFEILETISHTVDVLSSPDFSMLRASCECISTFENPGSEAVQIRVFISGYLSTQLLMESPGFENLCRTF